MTLISAIIKKEFVAYRQSNILWTSICENVVDVRIVDYRCPDNDVHQNISENSQIPIATLECFETLEKRMRKEVTSKDMYFYNNSMYNFHRDFGAKRDHV